MLQAHPGAIACSPNIFWLLRNSIAESTTAIMSTLKTSGIKGTMSGYTSFSERPTKENDPLHQAPLQRILLAPLGKLLQREVARNAIRGYPKCMVTLQHSPVHS